MKKTNNYLNFILIDSFRSTSRFYTTKTDSFFKRLISTLFKPDKSITTNFFVLQSIGEPVAISLRVVALFDLQINFYLDKAVLTIKDREYAEEFPCFQWIKKGR